MPNTQKLKRPSQHKGYPGPIEERKDDTPVKVAWITQVGVITVALFACVASVIGAIFASPFVFERFQHTPIPTQTASSGIQIIGTNPFPTEMESAFQTAVATIIPSISEIQTMAATAHTPVMPELAGTLVPPVPTSEMESSLSVILTSSLTEGKSPLSVNFNARDSFVKFEDGSVAVCGQSNFCAYMWAIYRDQKQVVVPFQGDGTFNYTFSGKGIYSVTVYVCRANVCADDGTVITVR